MSTPGPYLQHQGHYKGQINSHMSHVCIRNPQTGLVHMRVYLYAHMSVYLNEAMGLCITPGSLHSNKVGLFMFTCTTGDASLPSK